MFCFKVLLSCYIKINVTHLTCSLKKVKSPTKGSKTPPTPALIRSGEFQSSLGTEFPSCVKMTVKSQVTYGFWMESVVPIEDHEFEEEHDSDSTIFHNKNGRI